MTRFSLSIVAVFLGILLAGPTTLHGELIIGFDFEGEVLTPFSSSANVTANNFAYTGAATPTFPAGNGSADAYSANNWSQDSTQSQFFSFSFDVNPGNTVDLGSLRFSERRSLTSIHDFQVYINGASLGATNVPDNDTWRIQDIDASAFTGLTGNVEIRIYGFNAEAGTGTWRVDDVSLFGDFSAIPEPTSLLMFGSLASIFFGFRRRRGL